MTSNSVSKVFGALLTVAILGGCAVQPADGVGAVEQDETAAAAPVSWAVRYAHPQYSDLLAGVGTDAKGNLYVAGEFGPDRPGAVRVVKYSPNGAPLWDKTVALRAGQPHTETTAATFSVAPNGDSWITGAVRSGERPSTEVSNLFVARLDTNGAVKLTKELGPTSQGGIRAIAADPSGGVAVLGGFNGSMALPGKTLKPLSGTSGHFVAKLDASGQHQWSNVLSAGTTSLASLGVAANGDVYVSGSGYRVDFGAGPIASPRNYFGKNFFLAKLAHGDGHQLWAKGAGADGFLSDYNGPLAVLPNGGVAVAGTYAGTQAPDFGAGALPPSGGPFVVAYKSDGSLSYARAYHDLAGSPSERETPYAAFLRLAALPTGGLALAGASTPTAPGASDAHRLQKLSILAPDGQLKKSLTIETYNFCGDHGFCGAGGDPVETFYWQGLAAAPDGSVFAGARYGYEVKVGAQTFTADNSDHAQYDAFVAKLKP